MIEIENIAEFCAGIERYVDETESEWTRIYGRFAQNVFMEILDTSPQWSGNFVANWAVSVGYVDVRYQEYSIDEVSIPSLMGRPEAIAEAMDRNADFMQRDFPVLLSQVTYITNNTPYGEIIASNSDPDNSGYATTFLRLGNYINPAPIPIGHVMQVADKLWGKR